VNAVPETAVLGLRLPIAGAAAIVNEDAADVLPRGFATVTFTEPAVPVRVLGTVAVN
jgi:hypothetical protein